MGCKWAATAVVTIGWALAAAHPGGAAPASPHAELDARIREVAALPGEPHVFESAGVTRQDLPMRSIESLEPVDSSRRRLVIIGGLDGDDRSVSAVLGALRWFKTAAPAAVRSQWSVTALPCGNPEGWAQFKPTNNSFGKPAVNYPPEGGFFDDRRNVEARYIWRWIAFQAPDLVLDVQGGNSMRWMTPPASAALGASVRAQPLISADTLEMALSRGTPSGLGTVPSLLVYARDTDGPELLRLALGAAEAAPARSPLRRALLARTARSPLEVASLLAARYPQSPSIDYISAVAWNGALRLARLRNDPALREKVRQALQPYLSGARPTLDGNVDTVRLAGHSVFAELAGAEGDPAGAEAAKRLTLEAAVRFKPEKADDPARLGRFWTDDMFMVSVLLAPAGRLSADGGHHDLAARTLSLYASRLQRPDGLFNHALDAPHAWGRGNGFAALSLAEVLGALPEAHAGRPALLEAYRKQMAALKPWQAPEGTWRQVVDHPESYREVTATAMLLAAMARGIRQGWLDKSYLPMARRAWSGLSARIENDGGLVDVSDGTAAGPSLRYYYERPALSGMNER
ncbi:MAG TPA: glycoside hydrolase family 88 protein, partial [Armatimonadota bacterium]|nr:glycoside hydrolase family 88 protein [Armatimonadota bacterium]